MSINWKWAFIRAGCPNCGAGHREAWGLQHHSLTVWCLTCKWARNWSDLEARYKSDPSRR